MHCSRVVFARSRCTSATDDANSVADMQRLLTDELSVFQVSVQTRVAVAPAPPPPPPPRTLTLRPRSPPRLHVQEVPYEGPAAAASQSSPTWGVGLAARKVMKRPQSARSGVEEVAAAAAAVQQVKNAAAVSRPASACAGPKQRQHHAQNHVDQLVCSTQATLCPAEQVQYRSLPKSVLPTSARCKQHPAARHYSAFVELSLPTRSLGFKQPKRVPGQNPPLHPVGGTVGRSLPPPPAREIPAQPPAPKTMEGFVAEGLDRRLSEEEAFLAYTLWKRDSG
eukprot:TRINITY_DN27603_c0_g1_i2.p1 TRINITY_DN27603_c0_g1~~TRINITY_DN27603_c0_g1_i2.p1  ORF type:complete len:280 (+),score=31.10 TRINITY_DN27603_c0_g1_i2:63-902(+)